MYKALRIVGEFIFTVSDLKGGFSVGNLIIERDRISIDGKEIKIVSGAMHYFRIFPEYWNDRLLKLKEMGCNCVETYIAWNLHEKTEGRFETSGRLDLVKYIEMAEKIGLYVILRPGPFICSECDFGGLPWWLLKYDGIELRTYNRVYLDKVKEYVRKISNLIRPKLITNGGNVILVQIENEFGSYGDDKAYLKELAGYYTEFGIDVPFITSDGDARLLLEKGTLPGVYAAANFRWDSVAAMEILKEFQPDKPGAIMELWNGKAIHYGTRNEKRDLKEVEYSVQTALENASVINLYMFHGGTNFGFFNGSLYFAGKFTVQSTTYDEQAPLNEYGGKTEKYYIEQKVICDYLGKPVINETPEPVLTDYGTAELTASMPLSAMDKKYYSERSSDKLLTMEQCDQGYGYISYTATVDIGKLGCVLKYPVIHDLANLYVDGKLLESHHANELKRDIASRCDLTISGKHELTLFVESMGRMHFGPQLKDYKGLIGDLVIFDKEKQTNTVVTDWTIRNYPFEEVEVTDTETDNVAQPMLYKFNICLKPEGDTYVEVIGFKRGVVFINGFNLGRHWNIGPQKSLYIPKSLLRDGDNEIIVFDVVGSDTEKKVLLHGKQIIEGYTD